MTDQPYKKKLIEVALPLDAINAESAREKSIRHGHPSVVGPPPPGRAEQGRQGRQGRYENRYRPCVSGFSARKTAKQGR